LILAGDENLTPEQNTEVFSAVYSYIRSTQHLSVTQQVGGFFPGTPVSSTNKTDHHNFTDNIVESGIKHHIT
jgi:hypothetical protein